ncbi:MAG TPA: DUF371 domain-containing protein, partial [Jatrophihabitans sp.]|nr:DUF371 domain-containing protein [Jatrophihabitans sp.]
MRFVGRGHDRIRATHGKTLELSVDDEVTERATCVIAVAARPEPRAPLAGPVRIEITAGSESFELHALANSAWDPAGPAVIRRSPLRLPGTLATHADVAASELPRSLVTALRVPDTTVAVLIEPTPSATDTVVLYAADGARSADARLAAELAVADVVHAEDAAARRLVAGWTAGSRPGAAARRILVVATEDLPGRSVLAALADRATDMETAGLPARLAAAAAAASRGPLVLAPDDADVRDLLRKTPAGHRLVLTTDATQLPALVELAAQVRGPGDAVLAQEHAP